MAKKKTFDDLIQMEMGTIQSEIDKLQREQNKISKRIKALEIQDDRLWRKAGRLTISLETAKKDSAKLKRMAWKSDNPNVVDIRDQLLLVAKKLQDTKQTAEGG
ncbi:hypothetical protein LCGC14_1139510 [marine sediment metagenome]|uniref:Uncharacterized protein n=1 Tax=marine sediment metagenome TaxID=412755 RepID=A0A0F9LYP0_9ZZZZ